MLGKDNLYLVLGGRLAAIGGSQFQSISDLSLVGIYDDFAKAEAVWRGRAQATVDDALMRFQIVALQNFMTPTDSVADFLKLNPVSEGLRVRADQSVTDCCQLMMSLRVGAALVLDADDKPLGIFSERDVVRLVVTAPHGWRQATVADYMIAPVTSVRETDLLVDALTTMRDGKFRHLPVLDGEGRLSRVISVRDFAFEAV